MRCAGFLLLHRIGKIFVKNTPRAALFFGWKHCGCWGGVGGFATEKGKTSKQVFERRGSVTLNPLALTELETGVTIEPTELSH